MTNLTEEWKKGELSAGRYWVKYRSGRIDEWDLLGGKTIETKPEIVEILAEVPSYEQWVMTKNLSERAHLEMYKARGEKVKLEKENTKLNEELQNQAFILKSRESEITKLKELLKECGEYLMCIDRNPHLVEQIIELLGDK